MISNDDKITLIMLMLGVYFTNDLEWGGPDNLSVNTNSFLLTQEFNVAIAPSATTFKLWGPMFLSILMTCISLFGWANPINVISKNYTAQYETDVLSFAITVSVCDIGYIALIHYTNNLWLPIVVQVIIWRIVSQFYDQIHKGNTRFFFQMCTSLVYVWSSWELSFLICAQFQLSSMFSYLLLSFMFAYLMLQSFHKRDWMLSASVLYILAGICKF